MEMRSRSWRAGAVGELAVFRFLFAMGKGYANRVLRSRNICAGFWTRKAGSNLLAGINFAAIKPVREAYPPRIPLILPASGGVLTFFVYEEANRRAVERPRLEF